MACVILPYITKTQLYFTHSECNMNSIGDVCLVSNDKIEQKLCALYQIVPLGNTDRKKIFLKFSHPCSLDSYKLVVLVF